MSRSSHLRLGLRPRPSPRRSDLKGLAEGLGATLCSSRDPRQHGYFALKAGFRGTLVPFDDNAPLVTALLGGQIKTAFVSTAGVLPHVRGGLKGLNFRCAAFAAGAQCPDDSPNPATPDSKS